VTCDAACSRLRLRAPGPGAIGTEDGVTIQVEYEARTAREGGCNIDRSPEKLLEEATREELSACIQLLARSVVQHRAKFGIVALDRSGGQSRSDEAGATGLSVASREVLEEALELVRTLSAGPLGATGRQGVAGGEFSEARTQLRIKTAAPIKVQGPRHAKPVDATLENISWGGAAFTLDGELDPDEPVRLLLPRPQGGSIAVEARILRSWDRPDGGGRGVSVRFFSLGTRDEAKLESILEHLAGSGDEDGQRSHARLAQRLDIEFNGVQELRSTLEDISAGGLRITVPDPLPVGQSIQTVISTLDERCSLKLRARVVRQKPVKLPNGEYYHVGLKFEHPTEELNRRVQELLARVATASKD